MSISTNTFSPNTLSGYTSTFALGLCAEIPDLTSNAHACQGQITCPSSTVPWPSGPPRCGHSLPSAVNSPLTLATQKIVFPACISLTWPAIGNSALPQIRTNSLIPVLIDSPTQMASFYRNARARVSCYSAHATLFKICLHHSHHRRRNQPPASSGAQTAPSQWTIRWSAATAQP
jgi:hypothetical protein